MKSLWKKTTSAALSFAMLTACASAAMPVSAYGEGERTLWDFAEYAANPVTAAGKETEVYDGIEIHLAEGDAITENGLVWAGPCGTASNSDDVAGNNRYIKLMPEQSGTVTVKFSGNAYASASKAPRMYLIEGDKDNASFSKNGSDSGASATAKAKDTVTELTAELDAGGAYYIWPYYYNNSAAAFTVHEITYTEAVPEMRTRNIYESNMLLQRDEPVCIDGVCSAAVETAELFLINETTNETVRTAEAVIDGREWSAVFDAVSDYENTYKLVIRADGMEDIVYTNIIFGDQYLFSGQSNMWMNVSDYAGIDADAYSERAVTPHLSDKIRLMYTPGRSDYGTNVLQFDAQNKQSWRDFSTYANVKEVGAPAYTAAVKLHEETDVPIGVIDNPYPGSYISSWFDSALNIDNCNTGKNGTSNERNWYCGRIYPLRNLKLSGIFWYQGEADAATTYHDNPYEYYLEMLPRLIGSWRELFNDSDLPFYYTQLSRIGSTIVDENNPDTGAAGKMPIKRAQTDAYLNMEDKTNIGIVSTLDLYGNHDAEGSRSCRTDIHLGQKQYVGDRMANLALTDVYGKTEDRSGNAIYRMGPIYRSNELKADGSVVVSFDCCGSLSIMPSSRYTDTIGEQKIADGEINPNILNEFEMAGADGVWHTAEAEITADNQITLYCAEETEPKEIRYCGSDYPESPNLTDESGLPSYVFTASVDSAALPDKEPETRRFVFGTDTAAEGVIPINSGTAYGIHDGMRYGLTDIDESSIQNDFRFDGFTDELLTYPKSGVSGTDTYITADYSRYDEETLAAFGDGVIPVRFAAEGENGAYYTVKATIVNTGDTETEASLFGENRYMILYNHRLAAGESITKTWNVRLVGQYYNASGEYIDDAINVAAAGKNTGLVSVEITKHESIGKTIWLMTDSTGDNSSASLPYFGLRGKAGDGQLFTKYINPEIAVNNQGEGGLSSSDRNHLDNALKYMREGDYLYVQYGFNGEKAETLTNNLPRYYEAAKNAGAVLIVASPSERQSSDFWDSANFKWTGSNAAVAAAGKAYVDSVLADDPNAGIAFVDLNTNIINWMTAETARISALRKESEPSRIAMNYYYGYDRSSGVDSIHINDAGADNAAYIVYNEMKKNSLLRELTKNNSEETPYLVSDEIISKGWVPNDSYPYPLPGDVTYEYPTIVKGMEYADAYDAEERIDRITAAYKPDGSLEGVSVEKITAAQAEEPENTASRRVFYWKSLEGMEPYTRTEGRAVDSIQVTVQGDMQYYAIGAVDILDANGRVIKTAYSKSTDKNPEIDHIDNAASRYGETYTMYFDRSETVISGGGSARAYTVAVQTGEAPSGERYSSYYIPYETETADEYAPAAPAGLLTNELEYPLNVEEPAFGWIVNAEGENAVQTAYRIIVADEITGDTAWDSGKVESSEQSYIPCGATLEAGRPYLWKVKTWTETGSGSEVESEYSAEARFVTGITDWGAAKWISDGTGGASAANGKYDHYWYVRKTQTLEADKTVSRAYAFISGLQDYDLYVNDTEIGRGQSFDYASESRYQGRDITEAAQKDSGNINITALVRTYGGGQGRAAVDAGFLGYIKIYYTDGTDRTITTDNTWEVSDTTPYAADKTKRNGEGDFVEKYDARKSQGGSWTAATEIAAPADAPIAELSKPTDYTVHPVSVTRLSDGTTIADFGRVIPARPQITFANGTAGTQLTISGGYVLTADGGADTSPAASQSTQMKWIYTQKDGEQIYNAWDHLAFRYLSIPDCGEELTADTIAARVVHTNVPDGRDSTFVTSNAMLNDVYELMKRSALYSIQNSFVDTPTREKGQFLQDAVNISAASTVTQYERAASKKAIEQFLASADRYWTGDEAGRYNSVYPNGDGKRDIPDFTINFPYWVWSYYMMTGDRATLEKAYPYMKNTAEYISKYISPSTGLVTRLGGGDGSPNSYQYGIVDWPATGRFGYDWNGTKSGARTTVNMLSKRAFDTAALAAAELGYDADKTDMERRGSNLTDAINGKLRNADGLYLDGTTDEDGTQSSHISQHANSCALAFDVIPESDENKAAVSDYIASQGMKQGPMTADILVKGLFKAGETTAALKLFTEPNDCGWAREIKNGYTFTFEAWDADSLANEDSQSHGWGAAAAADMLENFAGVTVTEAGAKRVKIAPVYVDIETLDARISTERGFVGVNYKRTEDSFEITITVPANMTADIVLPEVGDGTYKRNGEAVNNSLTVGSGTYTFAFDGTITPPENVEYNEESKNTETEVYDLAEKLSPNKTELDAQYKGQSKELKLTDWAALRFGTGDTSISSDNGADLYNDGAYIKLTPKADGTISLDVKMRKSSGTSAASAIYMSTTDTASGGDALHSTVGKDTELTISDIEVKAGAVYYIYNSAARPTSIKKISYTHDKIPLTGIRGSVDETNKICTWEIGNSEAGKTVYTDTNDYADLTVGIGSGDNLSETDGIVYSGTAVPESGGVSATGRYILAEPKYSGTLTITYTCTGSNNRLYYYDFGGNEVDLSVCTKADGAIAANSVSKNTETTTAIDMAAGSKYVLYPYTYKGGSKILALSYAYTGAQGPEIIDNIPYEEPSETAAPSEPSGNSITLDRTSYPLVVGNSGKTDFSVWEDQGSSFTLTADIAPGTEYTESDITWSMDDSDIAYIGDNAVSGKSVSIHGKRTGFTRAAASLPNGDKAVCYISVIDNVTRSTVQTLEFNTDELTLSAGSKAALIPIINPKDVFGNGALDTKVGWASEDNDIVTVNNGVVTAKAAGTAKIMAKSDDVGRRAYCTVTVTEGTASEAAATVEADIIDMKVGDTRTLRNNAENLTWRSDNSFIADVDESGTVTAYSNSNIETLVDNENYAEGSISDPLKASKRRIVFENGKVKYEQGTVKIYATAPDGTVTTYNVRVSDAEQKMHDIKLSEEKTALGVGDTKIITAAILPANMMDKRVAWSSSNPAVVTVGDNALTVEELNSTVISGISAGTATVTAECGGLSSECKVTVTSDTVKVSDIRITNAKEIDIDEVLELGAEVTETAYDTELLWISSNADIVSVNNDGMIQGLRSGSVKIYAVAADRLTAEQREELEELQYERTVSEGELTSFLSDKKYGECDITVKDSSPYLRNLHAPKEAVTDNSVNLLWNRASLLDTGDFDSYNVYVNDTFTANVKTLGYTADNLTPDTEYTFKVDAVNADGTTVFESSSITVRTKKAGEVINVMDAPYNAKGDGRHTDTLAIQKAIDDCPENGTVYLPEGNIFYSGALFLKSNMTFKADGILIGSTYSKDYPLMVTRWEGWRKVNQEGSEWANTTKSLPDNHYAHASLINAGTYDEGRIGHAGNYNAENIVICGNGQINGSGFKLGYNEGVNQKTGSGGIPVPMSPAIDQTVRGRLISVHNADGLYIKDIQAAYSPSWTIHPIYSKNLTFDNLDIVSKGSGKTGAADDICILNGDGIDPDSCVNVNIFNTYFYTGDDAVAIKTGRNKEGNELNKATQFIRITDCESNGSKGGFAVGSENASGVKNVLMQNLKVRNISLSHGIWFKTYWSRGGLSENIIIRDIDSSKPLRFAMDYATATNNPADSLPEYRYITIENANSNLQLVGLGASEGRNTTYVNNAAVRGVNSGIMDYCEEITVWDSDSAKWTQTNNVDGTIHFYTTGQLEDTKIKAKVDVANIISIDNENRVINIISTAAAADIKNELTGSYGQPQTYNFYDGQTDIADNSVLVNGNTMKVTSQGGAGTAVYTIEITDANSLSDNTRIKAKADAVHVVKIGTDAIVIADGTTAEQIIDEIAPLYSLSQSYAVDTAQESDVITENNKLTVTANDAATKRIYDIKIQKSWDFRTWTPQADMSTGDASVGGVAVHGGSNDNISAANGAHFNGSAANGNRYVEFTINHDSTITVTGSVVNRFYCGTSKTGGGRQLSSDGTMHLAAGTYYMYPYGGATNLYTLMVTPDVSNEVSQTITIIRSSNGTLTVAPAGRAAKTSGIFENIAEGTVVAVEAVGTGDYEGGEAAISVKDENNEDVAVTNGTFIMPSGNVTVSAVYKPEFKQYMKPLSGFDDKLKIERRENNLIVTSQNSYELQMLILYTAIYNNDNSLKSVTRTPCEVNGDGSIAVPFAEPQLDEGESYKLMLWNTDQAPVIAAISSLTDFFG